MGFPSFVPAVAASFGGRGAAARRCGDDAETTATATSAPPRFDPGSVRGLCCFTHLSLERLRGQAVGLVDVAGERARLLARQRGDRPAKRPHGFHRTERGRWREACEPSRRRAPWSDGRQTGSDCCAFFYGLDSCEAERGFGKIFRRSRPLCSNLRSAGARKSKSARLFRRLEDGVSYAISSHREARGRVPSRDRHVDGRDARDRSRARRVRARSREGERPGGAPPRVLRGGASRVGDSASWKYGARRGGAPRRGPRGRGRARLVRRPRDVQLHRR